MSEIAAEPAPSRQNWRWSRGGAGGAGASSAVGPHQTPTLAWEIDSGAAVTARPLVVRGPTMTVAYAGNHAGRFLGIVAEGPEAGATVLELDLGGIIWSTAAMDPAGLLYVGADDDVLYAIDPPSRSIAWKLRLGSCAEPRAPGPEGARCDVDGGPTVGPDGSLYVGSDGLYRINREGEVVWHVPGGHVRGAPLVLPSGHVLYGAQDGFVRRVDPSGRLEWQYPVGPDVDASVAVASDGTIYAGADGGVVHAIHPDGTPLWTYATGGDVRGDLAIDADDRLYVPSHDGRVHALASDGALRFMMTTQGAVASAPVFDAAWNVYFGSRDDRLYSVTPTGQLRWSVELPADVDAAVSITPDGTVVVASDDGFIRGIR